MSKPRIVITGAAGFIGSRLVSFFIEKGYHVTALVHKMPEYFIPTVDYEKFELKEGINPDILTQASYLVHCAHQFAPPSRKSFEINYEGTKSIVSACRGKGVKKVIFISSFAARPDAISQYGKTKYAIEQLFNQPSDLIIRPGLVIGKGGIYQNIKNLICNLPIIPLIDGGRQKIQTLALDELCYAIWYGIEQDISGTFALAEKEPLIMKDFYTEMARKLKRKARYIPVPYNLAWLLLGMTELTGLRPGVTRENLRGLKMMEPCDVSKGIEMFKFTPKTFSESLKEL